MSGLLFLLGVIGFVVIAYWAFRNDQVMADGGGKGILAMKLPAEAKQKSLPKWKKGLAETSRRVQKKPEKTAKPQWRYSFLPRKTR